MLFDFAGIPSPLDNVVVGTLREVERILNAVV
jgi:hypothetical protein